MMAFIIFGKKSGFRNLFYKLFAKWENVWLTEEKPLIIKS